MLQDAAPTNVRWFDIDQNTAPDAIPSLRRCISGVKVICYIFVGTWEPFRAVRAPAAPLRTKRSNACR